MALETAGKISFEAQCQVQVSCMHRGCYNYQSRVALVRTHAWTHTPQELGLLQATRGDLRAYGHLVIMDAAGLAAHAVAAVTDPAPEIVAGSTAMAAGQEPATQAATQGVANDSPLEQAVLAQEATGSQRPVACLCRDKAFFPAQRYMSCCWVSSNFCRVFQVGEHAYGVHTPPRPYFSWLQMLTWFGLQLSQLLLNQRWLCQIPCQNHTHHFSSKLERLPRSSTPGQA